MEKLHFFLPEQHAYFFSADGNQFLRVLRICGEESPPKIAKLFAENI